jgi:predicted kinase
VIAEGRVSSIVILTGSPGTGKTTVAACLAKAKPRGLHIPSDVFYTFPAHPISPYRPAALEQNTDIIAAVTQTSAAFAGRGYHVILDGIFVPGFLPVMAGELQPTGLAVHYVVLRAPLEIALRRVQDRIGHEKDHVVRLMHAAFSDLGPFAAHAVDTGTRDADAVAAELGPSLDRGDFVLDLSQVAHGNRLGGAAKPAASASTGLLAKD